MIIQNISNHPLINSITRTSELIGLHFTETGYVDAEFVIKHFGNGVEIKDLEKLINLRGDNTETITYNGSQYGDLDLLKYRSNNGDAFKSIVEDMINYADAIGKINTKCNYL